MSSYAQTVERNLQAMDTPHSAWKAVPVSGMAETTKPDGSGVLMPVFEFPVGYSEAPSIFSGQEGCCRLCGHDIQHVYWIQCDEKRWTLAVGSECVTHFAAGESGSKLAKRQVREKQAAENRERVRNFRRAMKEVYSRWTYKQPVYWLGRLAGSKPAWATHLPGGREAQAAYSEARKVIGDIIDGVNHYDGKPIWSDRQIANWIKKNGPAIAAAEAKLAELLKGGE